MVVQTALGSKLLAEIHGVTITPVAAQFTRANSEYLSIADNAALSMGTGVHFTLAGWFRLDSVGVEQMIFAKQNGATSLEYRLVISADDVLVFQVSPDGTLGATVGVTWSDVVVAGQWYFWVVQYDGASLILSLDRLADREQAYASDVFNGTAGFALGAESGTPSDYLDGRLDAIGVWKRVLSADELNFLYNGGHARRYQDLDTAMKTSMVAWWSCNETSGNRADSHGANTLTDNNTVTSAEGVPVVSFIGLLPIDTASDEDGLLGVGESGVATFTCRATPENEAKAAIGNEIRVYAEGEADPWVGFINTRDWGVGPDETRSMTLQCRTLDGREVGRRNTFRGIEVTDATVQEAADAILAGTGWSCIVTGSGFPTDITKRWDNTSRLAALIELARIAGGFLRRTAESRQYEISNEVAASGIALKNYKALPFDGPGNPRYGGLAAVRRLREDGNRVVNRIAPYGKTDGDTFIDLRSSTRSSPYAIQSMIPKRASVVKVVRVQGPAGSEAESWLKTSIPVVGANRAILVFAFQDASVTGVLMTAYVNGKRPSSVLGNVTVGNDRINRWYFANPAVGEATVELKAAIAGGTRDHDMIVLSLQDVDFIDPVRTDTSATGSSTTPSLAITSAISDLIVDFLAYDNTAVTPTPTAGQTVIESASNASSPTSYLTAASVGGQEGSTTVSYSLSGSETWGLIGFAIKSAPVYYVEDEDSQADYGLSEVSLALGDFSKAIEVGYEVEAANTLYDRAVNELLKRKAPATAYDCDALWLPEAVEWLPGDSMAVEFFDEESGMSVDADLIVVKRTRLRDATGATRWKLTLSTLTELQDEVSDLVKLIEKVNAIQANQV